jgi:predicted RNA-binding Zn-ribbon protein involved in translation (DUF1610 family)
MRLELSEPYASRYSRGYLTQSGDGRRLVTLCNVLGKPVSSVSYARYLLSVHLGRFLTPGEHADHVDQDRKNDALPNLRVLPVAVNCSRHLRTGRTYAVFRCPACGVSFQRELRLVKKGTAPACSKSCARVLQVRR